MVSCSHPTYWLARRAYTAQTWGLGRQTGSARDSSASAAISAHTRVRVEAARGYGGCYVVAA